MVKHVIKLVNSRLPILVGCSSNCTATAVEQIKQYQFDGIDAILSAVPFYNKPSQEGVYRHFAEIAKASKKPIILYNVPGRTGINMTADTTLRIAREFKNVIGVKEASGKMDQINEIIKGAPDHFKVISGDDSLAMESIHNGAVGVISVVGNALPKTFGQMIHLTIEGKLNEAAAIHKQFEPVYGLLFKEGNPSGVKALMAQQGKLENVLRLPMVPVSDALNKEIANGFAAIKE